MGLFNEKLRLSLFFTASHFLKALFPVVSGVDARTPLKSALYDFTMYSHGWLLSPATFSLHNFACLFCLLKKMVAMCLWVQVKECTFVGEFVGEIVFVPGLCEFWF